MQIQILTCEFMAGRHIDQWTMRPVRFFHFNRGIQIGVKDGIPLLRQLGHQLPRQTRLGVKLIDNNALYFQIGIVIFLQLGNILHK